MYNIYHPFAIVVSIYDNAVIKGKIGFSDCLSYQKSTPYTYLQNEVNILNKNCANKIKLYAYENSIYFYNSLSCDIL